MHVPWLIVALLYMALIWYLSSQPLDHITLPPFPHADKLIHFIEYALLAFFLVKAFFKKKLLLISIVVSVYGGLDEYHQSFVVGRSADVYDFIADSIGGVLVCWSYFKGRFFQ